MRRRHRAAPRCYASAGRGRSVVLACRQPRCRAVPRRLTFGILPLVHVGVGRNDDGQAADALPGELPQQLLDLLHPLVLKRLVGDVGDKVVCRNHHVLAAAQCDAGHLRCKGRVGGTVPRRNHAKAGTEAG